MQTPIETVEDLAHQTKIQYGTLMNSQLQNFFMDTDVPRYLELVYSSSFVAATWVSGVVLPAR